MKSNNTNGDPTRRKILRGTAAAGAAVIGSSAGVSASSNSLNDINERGSPDLDTGDGDRTVVIRTNKETEYTFQVTGTVTATAAPDKALNQGIASATLSNDSHEYTFSGEFTEFKIEGEADVFVDGDPFNVEAFPQNSLSIIPQGAIEVDVSASGRIDTKSDSIDKPTKRTIKGTIHSRTVLSYAGELTYLDINGRAKIQKNGKPINPSEALPSPLPGKMSFTGPKTDITVGVSGKTASDHPSVRSGDGKIDAPVTGSETVAKYDGRVESIELENGASAEIVPESKRVVCSAPEDHAIMFSTQSTEAFIYDEEVHKNPEVTVAAGETERIQYFGDVTTISIGQVKVSFDYEYHEEAKSSARLQMAAEFERQNAYDRLHSEVVGRVRHDADGIYAISSDVEPQPVDAVIFKLTDINRGDEGSLSITKQRNSDSIVAGKNTYQWRTDSGHLKKTQLDTLEVGSAMTMTSAGLSTETFEYEVPQGVSTRQVETQGWVPSVPWGDWIGDIYDGLKDVASGIAGVSADYLADAIEFAEVHSSEIAVTGGKILCNTINSFQGLATQFMDDRKIKALWKLRITGYSSMISLAGSGVFESIGDENYDCGACIAFIRLSLDVGLCGGGVSAFCAAFSLTTLGLGTVPCAVLGGAICSATIATLPDAEDICSGHSAPSQAAFC